MNGAGAVLWNGFEVEKDRAVRGMQFRLLAFTAAIRDRFRDAARPFDVFDRHRRHPR